MNALTEAGWHASLDLQFGRAQDKRTVLHRRRFSGPLRVQKAFYPGDGVCHVYILHPPGGVVGGDALEVGVKAQRNAAVLLTTPASTKIYRSAGATSKIDQRIRVEAGASLEWLPRDTMLFGGSRLNQNTVINLSSDARFFGWEMITLGRPKSDDHYETGQFNQRFELHVEDAPVLIERQAWCAGAEVLAASWGLQAKVVVASCYAYPADQDVLDRVRLLMDDTRRMDSNDCEMSATLIDDVLAVRALGNDATALHQSLVHIWSGIRPLMMRYDACPPRIWAT